MRHLLGSAQIEKFFDPRNRDAQELLPHLIRRLIRETVSRSDLRAIRIPVADDISTPGFDGVVEVAGDVGAHVPPGRSVWEASTGEATKELKSNYLKRRDNATTDTAFVFVTPHTKTKEQLQLLETYRTEQKWRSIHVIDAQDLEEWLETCPATARWLLAQFGLEFGSFWDVSSYVSEEINAKYGTRVVPDLLLGGRSEECTELTEWFESTGQRHRVVGDTVEEAAAFIAAVVLAMEDAREYYESRVLFVLKRDALDMLSTAEIPYIIVPLAEEARKPAMGLVDKGARILHPCQRMEREQVADRGETVLSTLRRESIEEALKTMGFRRETASLIARESKGSLLAVLWQIQDAGDMVQAWASPEVAESLIPMLLAAEWEDGSEEDWKLIEALSGRSTSECRSVAKRWEWPAGPLIRRGSRWDWVAWPYAFQRLAQYIDDRVAGRFVELAIRVLSERDPALDMATEDRWLASIRGKVTSNTSAVRSGLAASTTLLAIHGHRMQGVDGQGCADRIVQSILCVDPDQMTERWLSATPVLDDLAEAAPAVFVECGNRLAENEEAVIEMFKEEGYFGRSSHTYLLWGAERLAWAAEYLTPAVLFLGALAKRDPGGRLSNRPANSLTEILLDWHPNTTASVSERLDAIDALRKAHPDVAWKTCEELFSGRNTISSPTEKPRWRDWDQDWLAPTYGEIREFGEGLLHRLLSWAGESGSRWAQLAEAYGRFKGATDMQRKLVNGLRAFGDLPVSDSEKAQVADALRALVSRHRRFSSAKWALPDNELEPLDELLKRFEPADPIVRNRWLFQGLPEVPAPEDADIRERFKLARAARKAAIAEVLSAAGLDGVLQMAASAQAAGEVGTALADAELDSDTESRFLSTTLCLERTKSETPKGLQAAWQYIAESYARGSEAWLDRVLRNADIRSSQVSLVNLALALPPSAETWDAVRDWGEGIEEAYWKQCAISVVRDPSRSANRAVRALLDAGRPYRALQVVCLAEHRPKPEVAGPRYVSPDLIVDVLRSLTKHSIEDEWQPPEIGSISHYVERLFGLLDEAEVDVIVVAQLEFALLPFLEHTDRGPKSLVAAIETTPRVFVDLLEMVYRAEGEEERELSERDRAAARLAYGLLSNLQAVPGTKWTKSSESDGLKRRFEGDITFPVGEVDERVLGDWIEEARRLAAESGRLEMCDQKIGELFAHAPGHGESEWPCEAVRSQIEVLKSKALEEGIETGVFNKRGVHWRDRGGKQERLIAERFRGYLATTQSKWPRTSAVLRRLAESFERLARHEDEQGLVDEFM